MKRRDFLGLAALAPFSTLANNQSRTHTAVVLDDRFLLHHISSSHPESPARYRAIKQQLEQQKKLQYLTRLSPWPLDKSEPWLRYIHSAEHIAAIKQNDPSSYQYALLATGAVLAAVEAVFSNQAENAFCACRPPGHHALNTGREEGFCYFNHIAIAARYAQRHHHIERVLIVDWDYHHGNGTEWAFYDDPSVLYFSTHDQFAYPGTGSPERRGTGAGEGFNINVHLDCGSGDADILSVFEQQLKPAVKTFKPQLVLISAGFDSRKEDLLGCFSITDNGFRQLTQWVKRIAETYCDGRLVSVLEGGYNIEGNAKAVITHLQALSS